MASSPVRALLSEVDWPGAHVVSIGQFPTVESLQLLLETAADMRRIVKHRGGCKLLEHKVLANVFYEASTRTSCSFAAAMQRLGGSVLQVNESTSSATKGETLGDTMRCLQCYADAVVLRHPSKGSAATASAALGSRTVLLNAGDGVGEHPTQALLDLATMHGELGLRLGGGGGSGSSSSGSGLGGLVVTLVGDLKHGRTVHSLARLLASCGGVSLQYVCPGELDMPADVRAEVGRAGAAQATFAELTPEVLAATDVLYVTRVQKERFASADEYERLKHAFVVTAASLAHCKPPGRMVVMHPLPRVGEIAEDVDADPRAAYFRQMEYGLHVRMALLALSLGVGREAIRTEADAAEAGRR